MGPEGQIDATQPTPIGRIPTEDNPAPALPTLNPADSPYKPLDLPAVEAKQIPVPEAAPEPQNLGAVSHAGSIAYMADKILRGAMQGYDMAQAHKADQFNKKLKAQQEVYNDQAKQLHDMAVAGVDPNSQEFKDARNRVLASWQATMQTIGERIPQPKQSKKSKQGQSSGQDQSNLIQRAMNHQNDPQDALQAVYQGAVLTGPPVFHQIAPYLTPQYQQQQRQKAAGQAATTEAGTASAELNARKAQLENDLLTAEQKGDTAAASRAKTALSDLQEAMSPYHRPTADEQKRQDYDALLMSGQVPKDANNTPLSYEAWVARESAAGRATGSPKPLKYDAATDQIIDPATNTRYSPTDSNLPPDVKAAFEGTSRARANKQTVTGHTSTYFFNDADGNRHEVQVTTEGFHGPANVSHPATAVPSAPKGPTDRVIGNVGSPAYKQLIKQATDAQKDFNNASTNLSTMLKTAQAAKNGDGSAQVGILANYLKTVVGGQGTGLRITKAEWDAAAKTRPWIQGVQATFSPSGVMTGAAISPQQVDQMVNEVHAKTKSLYDTAQTTKQRANEQKAEDMKGAPVSETLPAAARAQLKEGHVTTFANGQKWTLKNGEPEQVQ